ncbi:mycothiol synthase [Microbispora sp. RL4-1S]|uniref:Mycothiol acetyltransferase n=1 Tax=Microbispora oryzae TaxID=2806554 RepID=A0A941AJI1_9ACTN|nr:mycothiol synthase [Microbispora oryzae]MBP2705012.1 mycothiol synthase [Microbispora oryzae]
MNTRVEIHDRLSDTDVAAVLAVADAATDADGVRPLNEQAMLHLRHGGGPGVRALVLRDDGAAVGFAQLGASADGPSGELVIHPGYRRRGLGRRLLEAVLEESGGHVRLWAHGDHPGAAGLARALGLDRARALWRMRRPLTDPLPAAPLPGGVRLRAFEPGRDEEAWLTLNALAFATHPEQGAWTIDDLKQREREPWFDSAGFLLAVRGDALAGFHWTKVHEGEAGGPIGEVYVVGVAPGERGSGLGRALTLAGLAHLRSRGLAQVMLYVDEENTPAIRLYESLGFTHWDTDVMYRR